jgi:hypothetical protein
VGDGRLARARRAGHDDEKRLVRIGHLVQQFYARAAHVVSELSSDDATLIMEALMRAHEKLDIVIARLEEDGEAPEENGADA